MKTKLKELAKLWKRKSEDLRIYSLLNKAMGMSAMGSFDEGALTAYKICAEQLETLLKEEE